MIKLLHEPQDEYSVQAVITVEIREDISTSEMCSIFKGWLIMLGHSPDNIAFED